ncbi:MAG TPA: hypothetical protein VMY39_09335 [Planctomycetota bacterium]|nr:hypothetical protein [Planctomycetota bacterium]
MRKLIVVVLILAVVAWGAWWGFRASSSRDVLLKANADDLVATVVTPHLECPMADGKNVVWCATFQIAWNQACALIGEDIHLVNEPAMVAVLNKKTARKSDVDDASCVALAGWTADGIDEQIRHALREKFGADAPTELADMPDPPETMLVAYACLVKDLKFQTPFESLDDGELHFRGTPVKAFGLTKGAGRARDIARQVLLYDEGEANSPEGCLVELVTQSEGDRLILAMVKPAATLEETIAAVSTRLEKATANRVSSHDRVLIPRLNFDLLKSYTPLVGKTLKVKNAEADGLFIAAALQTIRFELNQHGAKLRSEARLRVEASVPLSAPPVFDRPFLILLQRTDAKTPYFALWVDNVELLMPIK